MNCITSEWDELIYRDLARGIYCPDAAEVEAFGPLPPEEHTAAEYTTLEVQELLTGIAADLKTIFHQGETLNRFSAAYADLCPKLMDLLRLAACSLTTLYMNGEDVNAAAVSVLELRRLASFHFRKCQAAARAALGRNETIWVRTSGLELQWAKLLLRLKQTEVRFSRPLPRPKTVSAMVVSEPIQLPDSESSSVSESAAEPVRTLPQASAIYAAAPFRAPRPAPQPAFLPELHAAAALQSSQPRGIPRAVSQSDQTQNPPQRNESAESLHPGEQRTIPQTAAPHEKTHADQPQNLPQRNEPAEAFHSGEQRTISQVSVPQEKPQADQSQNLPQRNESVEALHPGEQRTIPRAAGPHKNAQADQPQNLPQRNKTAEVMHPDEQQKITPADESVLNLNEEDLRLLKEFADLQRFRESRGLPVSRDLRLSDLFVPYGAEVLPPEDS